jgi:hypothetical protein
MVNGRTEVVFTLKLAGIRAKFVVHIWDKKYHMLRFTRQGGHSEASLQMDKKGKPFIQLNFWRKRLGVDYVTHEFIHGCIYIANIYDLKIQTPFNQKSYIDEEIFVRLVGKAVRIFYKKLYEIGFIETPDFIESRPLDL